MKNTMHNNRRNVLWLRIAYWWGILADTLEGIFMVFPQLHLRMMNIDLAPDPGLFYGLRYGAPVMFGFTAILLWADRKPGERKDVLLITALVPVLGYYLIRIYSIAAGLVVLEQATPTIIMQTVALALFIKGYLAGQRLEQA